MESYRRERRHGDNPPRRPAGKLGFVKERIMDTAIQASIVQVVGAFIGSLILAALFGYLTWLSNRFSKQEARLTNTRKTMYDGFRDVAERFADVGKEQARFGKQLEAQDEILNGFLETGRHIDRNLDTMRGDVSGIKADVAEIKGWRSAQERH